MADLETVHDTFDHTGLTGVGGSLTVQDEGTPLATGATTMNFVGSGVTASGGGATKTITIPGSSYFSRRILATAANANETLNLNLTSYSSTGVAQFYHDWDQFPATHFLITTFAQSSEAAQTISCQLAASATPTNPVSAAGDDLVITNTLGNFSSGWVAVSDVMSGLTLMCIALKGSNGTVDLAARWLDIAFKIA